MNTTDTEQENSGEAQKLPLWRECAKEMIEQGLEHGKAYPIEYFVSWLKCSSDTPAFSIDASRIRGMLLHEGVYLAKRGPQFVLLPVNDNQKVMRSYSRKARNALKRGVVLGTNTRLDLLGAEDRRRHESLLEKMAVRFALVSRTAQIVKALPQKKAHLLLAKSA